MWHLLLSCMIVAAAAASGLAPVTVHVGSEGTQSAVGSCNLAVCTKFSPNKIDYRDTDIAVAHQVYNESACCSLCAAHNARLPAGAPASSNCTIAVWHGPGIWTCNLKATASQPFNSTTVVAVQPAPGPPPAAPLRFASIYTDHAVLQAAPSRSVVWGFANVAKGTQLRLDLDSEGSTSDDRVSVDATLQPLPPCSPYSDKWIWRALLPATPASFASHTLSVSGGGLNASITDVVFGDVFACGGQSNMEYSINGSNGDVIKHPPINDSLAEIATMRQSRYSGVRMIRAGHNAPTTPALELPTPSQGGEPFAPVVGWTRPCSEIDGAEVCRVDVSALCWLFGRNVHDGLAAVGRPTPIGLVQSCWSGSPDEDWSTAASLRRCGVAAEHDGGMFNGMIRPLLNTTIKGAIWYQGESDSQHPAGVSGYNCTFPSMVDAWRGAWHDGTGGETDPSFPFGFVQLNSMGNDSVYDNPSAAGNFSSPFSPGFAGLRWAQTSGHGYVPNDAQPNTFMAVAYDTPDRPVPAPIDGHAGADPGFNVHSPFKQPTAARLARAALATVYNVTVDTVGPLPGRVIRSADGRSLVLTVERAGSGVAELRTSRGFEVLAGEKWVSVPAVSRTASTVTISPVPAAASKLRYNWYTNPCGLNCYGCAVYANVQPVGNWSGELPFLPLPPFMVDL
jgi:sialate O-acetylesterase